MWGIIFGVYCIRIYIYICIYIYVCIHIYIHIYLVLLISMLWHRQAIFKSKGDKLCSSAESRIWTRGPRHQIASRLNARWQTDWAIEGQAKNLNSTARPYDQRAFSPLDPTVSWLSHLALAICPYTIHPEIYAHIIYTPRIMPKYNTHQGLCPYTIHTKDLPMMRVLSCYVAHGYFASNDNIVPMRVNQRLRIREMNQVIICCWWYSRNKTKGNKSMCII